MKQGSLLSQVVPDTGWRPPETLRPLDDRFKRIGFDSEWDGVDWLGRDKPIGYSLALEDGSRYYLPFGHQGGGNLDKGMVLRYLKKELRGKTLVTLSGKGDIHMSRKDGLDLEAMGCKINEVQHKAALLSDQRRSFKLEDMAFDFLGKKKVEIDRSRIWELPSFEVGPYAEEDAGLTLELDDALQPKIDAENLNRVLTLEDKLIWCTCEMERNGVPLNQDLMHRWKGKIRHRFEDIVMMISKQTGLRVNPNSGTDLAKLFNTLSIPYGRTQATEKFPQGQPSFTDEFLETINNETVALCREGRSLDSLSSKYVGKYLKSLRDGILYYQLHQLKGDEEYGTISGRYSSSKVNIQQVFDPERQADKFGHRDYIIRYLFLPGLGMLWVKADASQIEFRLFVHYSRSKRLIDAYNNNPDIDFHEQVAELCSLGRKAAKNINFGMLYGMGRDKLARQLGLTRLESDPIFRAYNYRFPETRALMNEVMGVAKDRGYIMTLLGRRARFPDGEYLHAALNRALQGSAADILKLKTLEVYDLRRELEILMRLTVHDEFDVDAPSVEHALRLKEVLEAPIPGLSIRVPIKWDISVGKSWGDTSVPKKWKQEGWVPSWEAAA